ncbi:MAG: Holliday junction branch migration protein RuvA [Symbiobacteriaceae bacterium]|nr:Holliday junction branch migration protein RuvA [Symbiobacteriaceae bacterium]
MIAYMEGKLVGSGLGYVILDIMGVGWRLLTPNSMVGHLPSLGEPLRLFTYLVWREDGPTLYGFGQTAEVELFQRLLSVSGIGPKVALAILGYAPPERLLTWLIYEDHNQLRKIPGVGLKTAQRLVLELKEKVRALAKEELTGVPVFTGALDTPMLQALEALVSLGFDHAEAAEVIQQAQEQNPLATLEQLIAEGLRRLAR